MKILLISLSLLLLNNVFSVHAQQKEVLTSDSKAEYNTWLRNKFSEQHQMLIPIVMVANTLYSCNVERKIEPVTYKINELVLKMDKNRLAHKLIICLGDDDMQSEVALNFGLVGCFHEQLAHLPEVEQLQKKALVKSAILSLTREERKKSLTQCVTEQAIHYLK